jgi:hypothetical protein
LQNHKAGSAAGILAQDSAVMCLISLQFGVPLETIRRALMRDAQGRASGPLAAVLDRISADPFSGRRDEHSHDPFAFDAEFGDPNYVK